MEKFCDCNAVWASEDLAGCIIGGSGILPDVFVGKFLMSEMVHLKRFAKWAELFTATDGFGTTPTMKTKCLICGE